MAILPARRSDVLVRRPPGARPPRDWRVTADAYRHRIEALVRAEPGRALAFALVAGWVVGKVLRAAFDRDAPRANR